MCGEVEEVASTKIGGMAAYRPSTIKTDLCGSDRLQRFSCFKLGLLGGFLHRLLIALT